MNAPGRNYPLIRKLREHIAAHPEEHDQAWWGIRTSCGTTLCAGGRTVELAGWRLLWIPVDAWLPDGEHFVRLCANPGTGEILNVNDAAQRELGLTTAEAVHLFFKAKDRVGVLAYLDQLLGEEPG